MREYNYQAFTPEEVEQGLHLDLLNYLLDHNKKNETQYYDIHITSDGYCTIIEWTDVMYDNKYGQEGKFEYVPYNGQVMLELLSQIIIQNFVMMKKTIKKDLKNS